MTKEIKEIKQYPEIGLLYQHYKGGTYEPLFISTHTETGEQLINYKSIHFGSYHSRPVDMWFDKVEYVKGDLLYKTTRFRPLGDIATPVKVVPKDSK